jgi:hypothetical protein
MGTDEQDQNAAADIAANIHSTVQYVLRLKATPAQWARIAEVIETAINAAATGDLKKLRQAWNDLVRNTPMRVKIPDGSESDKAAKASAGLEERANVLIHKMESMQAASGKGSAKGSKGN